LSFKVFGEQLLSVEDSSTNPDKAKLSSHALIANGAGLYVQKFGGTPFVE